MRRAHRSVKVIDLQPRVASFRDDVLEGLSANPPRIAPKYFYDRRGSELFEEITRLPEYYLTRTEIGILRERAAEIASLVGPNAEIVEFGSGNSTKIRLLLDRMQGNTTYMPVDISRGYLLDSVAALGEDYPDLQVVAVCADYTGRIDLPSPHALGRRLVFFPGSTIGNFEPEAARAFFRDTAEGLRPGDAMLIGVDLKKPASRIHAAYNDRRGVTAEFNLNLLARINRELEGSFDLDRWEHLAFYNEERGRVEMHLRSRGDQEVTVARRAFTFVSGAGIHTENSYKYSVADFYELLESSRFRPELVWADPGELFSVHYLRVT
jgi:dimethylhistidine N-methyltransferase